MKTYSLCYQNISELLGNILPGKKMLDKRGIIDRKHNITTIMFPNSPRAYSVSSYVNTRHDS